jgi:hypothetical protein
LSMPNNIKIPRLRQHHLCSLFSIRQRSVSWNIGVFNPNAMLKNTRSTTMKL